MFRNLPICEIFIVNKKLLINRCLKTDRAATNFQYLASPGECAEGGTSTENASK